MLNAGAAHRDLKREEAMSMRPDEAGDLELPPICVPHVAAGACGLAIPVFEPSDEFAEFNTKYDYRVSGQVELSAQEKLGLDFFNGKVKCANWHLIEPPGAYPYGLFADFTYGNHGLPMSPRISALQGVDTLPPVPGLGELPDIAAKHNGG